VAIQFIQMVNMIRFGLYNYVIFTQLEVTVFSPNSRTSVH